MHIVFIKNYDIWLAGRDYIVERSLGARLCEMGVAVPYSVHLDMLAKVRAKDKAAEKAKVAKLLKEKEEKEKETADSKPAKTRSKSIKK